MQNKKLECCQAPWGCNNVSAQAAKEGGRHILGLSLCRSCYQYAWEQAGDDGRTWENKRQWFFGLPGPARLPESAVMACAGSGCDRVFKKDANARSRRFVGRLAGGEPLCACRSCYQRAYEFAKERKPMTIAEAFALMPPRKPRVTSGANF